MFGRSETSAKNNQGSPDGKLDENVSTGLKEAIEKDAERSRGSLNADQKIDHSEQQSIEKIFTRLSRLPYNKAKDLTGFDRFALTPDEEELNGVLLTYIVIYYLPDLDLGKFCLWAFVILNVALLIEKTIVYADYKKKQKKIEVKTEDKK